MTYYIIHSGSNINCNIFSYDYSGYGASSGRPSEKNLYADIEAAWNFLRTKYGVSPENIILYGQVKKPRLSAPSCFMCFMSFTRFRKQCMLAISNFYRQIDPHSSRRFN